VEEGSYIKMVDMVSGKGGQLQVCVNSRATHVKVASKVLFPMILLLHAQLITQPCTDSLFVYHMNTTIWTRGTRTVLRLHKVNLQHRY
jgi:hypothetical protein